MIKNVFFVGSVLLNCFLSPTYVRGDKSKKDNSLGDCAYTLNNLQMHHATSEIPLTLKEKARVIKMVKAGQTFSRVGRRLHVDSRKISQFIQDEEARTGQSIAPRQVIRRRPNLEQESVAIIDEQIPSVEEHIISDFIDTPLNRNNVVEFYLRQARHRVTELLAVLRVYNIKAEHLGELGIYIRMRDTTLTRTTTFFGLVLTKETTLKGLIRLAHIFDLTLLELLSTAENLSSLRPMNLEHLNHLNRYNQQIKEAFYILAENIQTEMFDERSLSPYDLQVKMGIHESKFRYLLEGRTSSTYHRFLQLYVGLLRPDEDTQILLERLLRNVSI